MSSNYEQAKEIMDLPGLYTKDLYREQKLEKASVLASLAVADELRAAREPAPASVGTTYVYALTRRGDGDRWPEAVSIYLVESSARKEAKALNEMAEKMDAKVIWAVSTYIVKEG